LPETAECVVSRSDTECQERASSGRIVTQSERTKEYKVTTRYSSKSCDFVRKEFELRSRNTANIEIVYPLQ